MISSERGEHIHGDLQWNQRRDDKSDRKSEFGRLKYGRVGRNKIRIRKMLLSCTIHGVTGTSIQKIAVENRTTTGQLS